MVHRHMYRITCNPCRWAWTWNTAGKVAGYHITVQQIGIRISILIEANVVTVFLPAISRCCTLVCNRSGEINRVTIAG